MFGTRSTVRAAVLAGAGWMVACGPPPANDPRFWDEEATRAVDAAARPVDAERPDLGSPDRELAGPGGAGGSQPGTGGSLPMDAGVAPPRRVPPEARPLADGAMLSDRCGLRVTATSVTAW